MECDCRVHPVPGNLSDFRGEPVDGNWTLTLEADNSIGDPGLLNSWCLRWFGDCDTEAPEELTAESLASFTPG